MEKLIITFDLDQNSPQFPDIEKIIERFGCTVVAHWSKPNRYEVSTDSPENLFELGVHLSKYITL